MLSTASSRFTVQAGQAKFLQCLPHRNCPPDESPPVLCLPRLLSLRSGGCRSFRHAADLGGKRRRSRCEGSAGLRDNRPRHATRAFTPAETVDRRDRFFGDPHRRHRETAKAARHPAGWIREPIRPVAEDWRSEKGDPIARSLQKGDPQRAPRIPREVKGVFQTGKADERIGGRARTAIARTRSSSSKARRTRSATVSAEFRPTQTEREEQAIPHTAVGRFLSVANRFLSSPRPVHGSTG